MVVAPRGADDAVLFTALLFLLLLSWGRSFYLGCGMLDAWLSTNVAAE